MHVNSTEFATQETDILHSYIMIWLCYRKHRTKWKLYKITAKNLQCNTVELSEPWKEACILVGVVVETFLLTKSKCLENCHKLPGVVFIFQRAEWLSRHTLQWIDTKAEEESKHLHSRRNKPGWAWPQECQEHQKSSQWLGIPIVLALITKVPPTQSCKLLSLSTLRN